MRKCFFVFCCLVLLAGGAVAQSDSPIQVDTLESAGSQRRGEFTRIDAANPVTARRLPQDRLASLKNSDDYWYANYEPKREKQAVRDNDSVFDKAGFRTLFWIVVFGSFIGIVVWYLASSNVSLFRKAAKKIDGDEEGEAVLGDDIFSINYGREIERATAKSDYRLATRLWYLQTLKALSDRGLIDYRPDRTDSDYVASLYGGPHYRDFARLTRHFEYAWYGRFPLSTESYGGLQRDFQTFTNRIAA